MPNQEWGELLKPVLFYDETALTAAAEGLLFADKTIPGGYFVERRMVSMVARFKYSNVVTTPGSITFRIRWGGLAGTILAQTSAIALSTTAQTSVMGVMQATIVCRSTDKGAGGTGSLLCMGDVSLAAQLAASNNQTNFMGSAGGASGNVPAAVTVNLQNDTLLSITYQSTVATGSITGMMLRWVLEN